MSASSKYHHVKDRLLAMLNSGSTVADIIEELDISRSMILNYRLRLIDEKERFIKLPSGEEGMASVVVSDHEQININRNIVDTLALPIKAKDRLTIKCEVYEEGYVITLTCAKKMDAASDSSNEVAAA